MSKLTNSIDEVLFILNIKFADVAMIISSYIEVFSYYNTFSWLILFIN